MDHQRDTADRHERTDRPSAMPPADVDAGPGPDAGPFPDAGSGPDAGASAPPRPVYRIFGREIPKPASRKARIALGIALTVLGFFGFLPILGFWMIPLGLFILSHETHPLRRLRRRLAVRRARKAAAGRSSREPAR